MPSSNLPSSNLPTSDLPPTPRAIHWSVFLYGLTILLGAFLVFQVQPIVSKTMLPWFGGSPAVWTTCMLFFQVLLFAGYAYAHGLTRLSPFWQTGIHLTLIFGTVLLMPLQMDPAWKQHASHPTVSILVLLATTVGLPYFVLASTGPLIQAWFSQKTSGSSPYRLYAVSNIGSLVALVTYPFVVEPALSTEAQWTTWSLVFLLYALSCAACALGVWRLALPLPPRRDSRPLPARETAQPLTLPRCLAWLTLAALASLMLLATTNHVCQDVAVIPFLWIAPLALYLLSFIICFDRERWYVPAWWGAGAAVLISVISLLNLLQILPSLIWEVSLYFSAMFCICMICHGELVKRKPPAAQLTMFYLMSSAGGALGGVLVAVVCPLIFDGYHELNVGLFLSYVLALVVVFGGRVQTARNERWLRWTCSATAFLGLLLVVRCQATALADAGLETTRNFYGVLRIQEEATDEPLRHGRYMMHGRISHGFQLTAPQRRHLPTTYFAPDSGLGVTLRHFPRQGPLRVGIIGLGAGTIAAYGQAGDYFRFYEINVEVERLARTYFTFLDDSAAHIEVVIGDARISMENESSQQFDVLVLDAFSGDAIPAHLLTQEAFEVYLRHVKPSGVICCNISNRHVNLEPVLDGVAQFFGLRPLVFWAPMDAEQFQTASHWFALTRNEQFVALPAVQAASTDERITAQGIPLWTDDYNNLFRVLK